MSVPRSKEFDDVYFSAEDGLAETRHVFLDGNDLPNKWSKKINNTDRFLICETGFGTGLNFLAAWKLFEETAEENQKLEFISFEKYPLTAQDIEQYLQPWEKEFGDKLQVVAGAYPVETTGECVIEVGSNVMLRLAFDDVNEALPKLDAEIDAWFLDGFKPSSNPDMWTETVFQNMARLSKVGTSFATFTAAGFVRRGLQSVGFEVQKVPGFGTKREMLIGSMK